MLTRKMTYSYRKGGFKPPSLRKHAHQVMSRTTQCTLSPWIIDTSGEVMLRLWWLDQTGALAHSQYPPTPAKSELRTYRGDAARAAVFACTGKRCSFFSARALGMVSH